jgi:hypothetical protein
VPIVDGTEWREAQGMFRELGGSDRHPAVMRYAGG